VRRLEFLQVPVVAVTDAAIEVIKAFKTIFSAESLVAATPHVVRVATPADNRVATAIALECSSSSVVSPTRRESELSSPSLANRVERFSSSFRLHYRRKILPEDPLLGEFV